MTLVVEFLQSLRAKSYDRSRLAVLHSLLDDGERHSQVDYRRNIAQVSHRMLLVRDASRRRNEEIIFVFSRIDDKSFLFRNVFLLTEFVQYFLDWFAIFHLPEVPAQIEHGGPEPLRQAPADIALSGSRHADKRD